MKKIITLFCFIASMQIAVAQPDSIDIKLQSILAEKNDETRIDLLYNYISDIAELDPALTQNITQKLIALAEKNNDRHAEAYAISQLGYLYFATGNNTKALELTLKALKAAESLNNKTLIAIVKNRLGLAYGTIDPSKRAEVYKQALSLIKDGEANQPKIYVAIAANLAMFYTNTNKLDSALVYMQLADKLNLGLKNSTVNIVNRCYATLYYKLKKYPLAVTYADLALNEAYESKSPRFIYFANMAFANYYYLNNQMDSSAVYSKKAIDAIKNTAYSSAIEEPANLLMKINKNKNNDLAMQYAEMYINAKDSLESKNKIQQSFLMASEEELRQKEIAQEKIKQEDQRKQNIQYALIALGIIVLLTLYLLLSRSFITNTKLIEFFGVVALLIVFEFLNLLLHPFLERITHHSPMLMLLALVCIAALLVPLHHKVEKWATLKLVVKNKQIRLTAAKKTIQQLDTKAEYDKLE